jgi:L-methionine (R)-S-oxide reductase
MCLPCTQNWKEGDRGKELMKACDGLTKSEIVIPLYMSNKSTPVGVLDLDSTVLGTFDEDDKDGLEGIVELLSKACDWA